jgi:hypothetical protein
MISLEQKLQSSQMLQGYIPFLAWVLFNGCGAVVVAALEPIHVERSHLGILGKMVSTT